MLKITNYIYFIINVIAAQGICRPNKQKQKQLDFWEILTSIVPGFFLFFFYTGKASKYKVTTKGLLAPFWDDDHYIRSCDCLKHDFVISITFLEKNFEEPALQQQLILELNAVNIATILLCAIWAGDFWLIFE